MLFTINYMLNLSNDSLMIQLAVATMYLSPENQLCLPRQCSRDFLSCIGLVSHKRWCSSRHWLFCRAHIKLCPSGQSSASNNTIKHIVVIWHYIHYIQGSSFQNTISRNKSIQNFAVQKFDYIFGFTCKLFFSLLSFVVNKWFQVQTVFLFSATVQTFCTDSNVWRCWSITVHFVDPGEYLQDKQVK